MVMGSDLVKRSGVTTWRRLAVTFLDLLLIGAISLVSQATHFSYKRGRTLPCGDSVPSQL